MLRLGAWVEKERSERTHYTCRRVPASATLFLASAVGEDRFSAAAGKQEVL